MPAPPPPTPPPPPPPGARRGARRDAGPATRDPTRDPTRGRASRPRPTSGRRDVSTSGRRDLGPDPVHASSGPRVARDRRPSKLAEPASGQHQGPVLPPG